MTALGFTRIDGRCVSDMWTATKGNVVFRVEFASGNRGSATVERSITGNKWIVAGVLPCAEFFEMNVCCAVAGQQFRVVTTEEPTSINVLE